LNDIISLLVGLWAVKAAQRSSSDKYSFGVSKITLTRYGYSNFDSG
jgi:Co/Zn/Cd efflux system component